MCTELVAHEPPLGLFGKLPAHGDFVVRELPSTFTAPWDSWIQAALQHSRERLGGDWLSHYAVAPIWRFVLCPGLCGQTGWRGLLMPSADRVNRYFPLTIAMPLRSDISPASALANDETWFETCEATALAALEPDIDADSLHRQLRSIAIDTVSAGSDPGSGTDSPRAEAIHVDLTEASHGDLLRFASMALPQGTNSTRCSLWWTTGSQTIPPSLLIHHGLPSPQAFVALLDGQWRRWGWTEPMDADLPPPQPSPAGVSQ